MLQISEQTETKLLSMAAISRQSVDDFIEALLENYLDDLDVKEAEQAMNERGGISLSDLKAKYEL